MIALHTPAGRFLAPIVNHRHFKAAVIAACALPALWTAYQIGTVLLTGDASSLGANPIERILRRLGEVTLILLCLTLAITPARNLLKLPKLLAVRRALGVATFAYGSLHLLSWVGWDMGFDLADIVTDLAKRPFIFVGMLTWFLMLPLAATSFNRAIKWMGGKRWVWLHKAVYAVAIAAVVHYWWIKSGKNNLDEPIKYAVIVALLLGWRVWHFIKARQKA